MRAGVGDWGAGVGGERRAAVGDWGSRGSGQTRSRQSSGQSILSNRYCCLSIERPSG